jgi:hypothetical protein
MYTSNFTPNADRIRFPKTYLSQYVGSAVKPSPISMQCFGINTFPIVPSARLTQLFTNNLFTSTHSSSSSPASSLRILHISNSALSTSSPTPPSHSPSISSPVSHSFNYTSLILVLTAISALPSLFSPQFLLYFSATSSYNQPPKLYRCYSPPRALSSVPSRTSFRPCLPYMPPNLLKPHSPSPMPLGPQVKNAFLRVATQPKNRISHDALALHPSRCTPQTLYLRRTSIRDARPTSYQPAPQSRSRTTPRHPISRCSASPLFSPRSTESHS